MYCKHCGSEVGSSQKYCKQCGALLSGERFPQQRIEENHVGAKRANSQNKTPFAIGGLIIVAVIAICGLVVANPFGEDVGQSMPIDEEDENASSFDSEAMSRMAVEFVEAWYNDWTFEDGEMKIEETPRSERCLPYIAEGTELYSEFSNEENFYAGSGTRLSRGAALSVADTEVTLVDAHTCAVDVSFHAVQNTITQESYDQMKGNPANRDTWILTFDDDGKIIELESGEATGGDAKDAANAWEHFPQSFAFTSGAGAWATQLEVAADGTFTGSFHDSEAGDTGSGYPNGTRYETHFTGAFTEPVKVGDFEYRMQLKRLEITDNPGEEIVDGVRVIHDVDNGVYGLGEPTTQPAGEFSLHLPGQSLSRFSDSAASWLFIQNASSDVSDFYAIVNSTDPNYELAFKTYE